MKVRLIAQFDNCFDTVTHERTIRPRPELAGFVSEQIDFCSFPAKFEFRDTTASAVKWSWSFNYWGDPVPEASTRVLQKEFTPGLYYVRLDVTNKEGCSSWQNRWIESEAAAVFIRMHKDYPGTPSTTYHTCDSARANFEAVINPSSHQQITKYSWDLGNGTTSSEVSPYGFYNVRGKYHKITLNYETDKGCKGSVVAADQIYISTGVKADFEPLPAGQVVCGSSNFNLTNTSTGNSLLGRWFIDNKEVHGGNFWGNVDKPGTYDVTLVVDDGHYCFDTITKKAAVVAVGPFPQFTQYENSCDNRGEVTFYQETIGGTSWEWDFGDGTKQTFNSNLPFVKHTYQAVGQYYVTLTATEGNCSIKTLHKTVPILLKQNLQLAAGKTKICKDDVLPVTITGFDPNYNDNYYQFVDHFEYEDGTRFNGYYFTYPLMGLYEGDLHSLEVGKKKIRAITVSGGFGCYDTTNYVDYQVIGAMADFTVNRNALCFNDPVVVKDASIKDNTEIVYWQWDFGDGTIKESTVPDPVTHNYTQPGNYTIQLKIRDQSGCGNFASTSTKQVAANGPQAAFETSGSTYELNTNVNFLNTTNTFGVPQAQYQWDFGDGTRSQEISPSHTYTVAGNYTVTLTATDPVSGCRSVFSRKIEVKNFAYGFTKATSFVAAGNCPPVLVRFNNLSQNFTRLVWDFGDGQTLENVVSPGHVYEQPGKYYIRLLVYGHNGLQGSQLDSVELHAPVPAIATNVQEVCKDGVFTLSSSTTGVKSYSWDFGDGTVTSGQSGQAEYRYSAPGTYQPRLLVTDSNGCMKAISLNGKLTVRDNPIVQIDPSAPENCEGTPVRLVATGGQSYDWQPAGGLDNAHVASPLASPSRTTQYTVTVKDDLGCSATSSTTVTVISKEQVTLTGGEEICQGEQLQLFASGASRYEWIGTTTGLSSTIASNPFVNALQTTTYTVVGFDSKGCFSDTATAEVIVRPLPTIDAGNGGVVLSGNSFQVTTTASPDVVSYNWTPSRFLDCYQCPSPLSKPLSDITYEVAVTNQYGCKATDTLQLHLLCGATGASIPNAFSPNGDGKNERFVIMGVARIKRLSIYDRWGNKVFDRKDFSASDLHLFWDGRYAGSPSPTGTYVYFAELECKPGETVTRKGSLLLIR
jgi:gliding motility-associated-like protein